ARAEDGSCERRALLVGVDDFVSRESTYPSSTNNVFAMQEVFQQSAEPFAGIFAPAVPVADAQALDGLIEAAFGEADDDDVSYLYISTHGVYESGGEPMLILSDGQTEGSVTPAQLEASLRKIKGQKVLLIDACNSGAFIGKGMSAQPDEVAFLGEEFKVLTSSGAMEESWYWNASQSASGALRSGPQGGYYFTQALSQGLGAEGGFAADSNRNGEVTLRELYDYLLRNHAASTPQVYPQEDDFVVLRYDAAAAGGQSCAVRDVTFSSTTLSAGASELRLEYIASRPVRVAYQVVYQREGKWRFDEARLYYDDVERYTAYGDEAGAVSPGRKVRSLTIDWAQAQQSGYVMVQVVTIDDGRLTVHAGCVLCAPPESGDLALAVSAPARYTLGSSRELAVFVEHAFPCVLSVAVVDAEGTVVRRLCHRQSTRPMQIGGSTFYWDGADKNGDPVPEGVYRIRASGVMGDKTFTVLSEEIVMTSPDG
ncbi:MAG: caspase family protein, partial [Eubacteriales bacterium]|nr:caspase family protein [Eubacteriales bacterium]